jgi:hypothetical protein
MQDSRAAEVDDGANAADDAELGEFRHKMTDTFVQVGNSSDHAQGAPFVMLRSYGSKSFLPGRYECSKCYVVSEITLLSRRGPAGPPPAAR